MNTKQNLVNACIKRAEKHGINKSQAIIVLDGMTYGFLEMKGKKHAKFVPLFGKSEKIDCLVHHALLNGIKIF